MSEDETRELIRGLAEELEPVRPIPPIRRVIAALLLLWLGVAAAGTAALGLRPDLAEATLLAGGPTVVLAGLGVAGVGGVLAGLALGVPGRERLARGAFAAAAAGMALAAGLGTLLLATSPPASPGAPLVADLRCLLVACAVGLLPAAGVVVYAGRAAPFRLHVLVLAAAAGAAALGAVAAHASCPVVDARHLLTGHVLAPAVGAFLLSLPLLEALKRLARGG